MFVFLVLNITNVQIFFIVPKILVVFFMIRVFFISFVKKPHRVTALYVRYIIKLKRKCMNEKNVIPTKDNLVNEDKTLIIVMETLNKSIETHLQNARYEVDKKTESKKYEIDKNAENLALKIHSINRRHLIDNIVGFLLLLIIIVVALVLSLYNLLSKEIIFLLSSAFTLAGLKFAGRLLNK